MDRISANRTYQVTRDWRAKPIVLTTRPVSFLDKVRAILNIGAK